MLFFWPSIFRRAVSRLGLLGSLSILFVGCAYVSQKAHLDPHPQLTARNSGNGARVVVRVVDSRASTRIGYRGMDSKLGEITSEQDVAALVRKQIVSGLNAKGFTAREFDGQPSSRLLRVEVNALEYTTAMDYLKGSIQTRAAFQVYFRKGDSLFAHLYQSEVKAPSFEAPGAKKNDALINQALNETLEKVLEDDGLLQFMAAE
ncbi:MAG TPA: YajG family lipoprotein [Candidatus Saccharimonadales bacterium]|nr:YajG family lipoprotein [Candidatus Saccharimonadales bacterium]